MPKIFFIFLLKLLLEQLLHMFLQKSIFLWVVIFTASRTHHRYAVSQTIFFHPKTLCYLQSVNIFQTVKVICTRRNAEFATTIWLIFSKMNNWKIDLQIFYCPIIRFFFWRCFQGGLVTSSTGFTNDLRPMPFVLSDTFRAWQRRILRWYLTKSGDIKFWNWPYYTYTVVIQDIQRIFSQFDFYNLQVP